MNPEPVGAPRMIDWKASVILSIVLTALLWLIMWVIRKVSR